MAKVNKTDLTTSTILDRPDTETVDNTDFMVLAKTDKDYKISATNFANSIHRLIEVNSFEHIDKYENIKFMQAKNQADKDRLFNAGYVPLDGAVLEKARYDTGAAYIPRQYVASEDATHITMAQLSDKYLRTVWSGAFSDVHGIGSDIQTLPRSKTQNLGWLGQIRFFTNIEGLMYNKAEGDGDFEGGNFITETNRFTGVPGGYNDQYNCGVDLYDRERNIVNTNGTNFYDAPDAFGTYGNINPRSFFVTPWIFVGKLLPTKQYSTDELSAMEVDRRERVATLEAKAKEESRAMVAKVNEEERLRLEARQKEVDEKQAKQAKELNEKMAKERAEGVKLAKVRAKEEADRLEALVNKLVEAKLKELKKDK